MLAIFTAALTLTAPPSAAGVWEGNIDIPGSPIGLIVHLTDTGSAGWIGSVDTPSQRSFGLPLSEVQVDGPHVVATCTVTAASWDAHLSDDGDALQGTWHQGGGAFPLNCSRMTPPPVIPAALATALSGTWEGHLDVGAVRLRIVLSLRQAGPHTITGHMVSPDQSPDKIPIGRVDWSQDRRMKILVGSLGATFDVTLAASAESLTGTFIQGGVPFGVELRRVDAPSVVRRPQTPQPPFPYSVQDVSYRNEADGVTLAGTLTVPPGDGPFPAALLITGSGGQDRNEEIFQHKPFWVIADYLARRGIAVLRVDDRGVGDSTTDGDSSDDTSHDFARDVEAGAAFLATQPKVSAEAIGLIGHSEGGVIAPIVAARHPGIAFIILMAGTGVPGHELLLEQTAAIMRADGASEEEIVASTRTNRALFDVLLDDRLGPEDSERRMRTIIESDPEFAKASPQERQAGMSQALAQLNTPWMRAFAQHDPATPLRQVTCPVLAINGELDLQVPVNQNLPTIAAALEVGGNDDVTVRAFPGLNHLFQHSETGLVSEYGQIEETISPEVLDLLAEWITARFPSPAQE